MKRGGPLRRGSRIRTRRLVARGEVSDKMLDDACRAVVFARDGYKCRRSGKTANLQWAHIYSRRYKSIRWDPLNSVCLNAGEHLWFHHQPIAAARWWISEVGEATDDLLRRRMRSNVKLDRQATLLWLKQELKRYQGRDSAVGNDAAG